MFLSSPRENKIDSVLNCNIMGAEQFKNVSLPDFSWGRGSSVHRLAMCEGNAFINVAALQWKLLHVTELLSQHYLCESKISYKAFIAQLCYGHYLCHFAQVSCSWHFFGVGIILRVLKALDNSYWVHFVRKSPVKVVYRHFWYIHFDCKINFNSLNSHLF